MAEIRKDVMIVGAGPAGLGAAIYTARNRFDTVVLDKFIPGGQINLTDRIENYPGIDRISGPQLVEKLVSQAASFGTVIQHSTEVTGLNRRPDGILEVHTDDNIYLARVVILSPGSDYRKLGVEGEEKFRQAGAGISYCGTCDAPFFKNKQVITIGGGNVAVEDTLHLARYCNKVIMVHRRQEFRAEKILVEELMETVKKGAIELKLDCTITSINGKDRVQSATVKNLKTSQTEEVTCEGVFIFVGMNPNTGFLKGIVDLDESGFIQCDPAYLRTNIPGVFAAGDSRAGAAMQLATAVADGVAAALFMKEYLRNPAWWDHKRPKVESLGW